MANYFQLFEKNPRIFRLKPLIIRNDRMKGVTNLKIRRSERLIDMTQYLLDHPHTLVSLTYFADRYQSAKSSISEDLAIVKKNI